MRLTLYLMQYRYCLKQVDLLVRTVIEEHLDVGIPKDFFGLFHERLEASIVWV